MGVGHYTNIHVTNCKCWDLSSSYSIYIHIVSIYKIYSTHKAMLVFRQILSRDHYVYYSVVG